MNEMIARITSSTPSFFKKVQAFGLWLVGIAGAILLLDIPEGIVIPPVMMTAAKYVVLAGAVIFGQAKLPVKDYEALKEKMKDASDN